MSGLAASPVPDRRECVRARFIASEECYRLLFEHHPQPMAIYEPSSLQFLDVNEAAVAFYGYSKEELLEMTVGDVSLWPAAADVVPVEGNPEPVIRKHARKDGTPIDVEVSTRELPLSGLPVRLLAIRDLTDRLRGETERKILEAQFRQPQKLEPVRRLAGGIAHDFNNLLTILLGYADWLETREGLDTELTETAREIHQAISSASVLVRQLLAFSRRDAVRPCIVNVNEALAGMHQMLRRMIGEDIELRTVAGAREATIKIDPGQLEQIVLNLSVNARDAIAVDSAEGTGTSVAIDLPHAPKEPARTDDTPPILRVAGGDEWILVVEDDARLRSLAEQILATRGYHVLSAAHAREALALIETHRSKLSLLLTDVVMPGTNGRELAHRALRVCPTLSVIYMSGYTDAGAILHASDTPQAFLGKPFTAVGLLELVRSTLDTARARAKTNTE